MVNVDRRLQPDYDEATRYLSQSKAGRELLAQFNQTDTHVKYSADDTDATTYRSDVTGTVTIHWNPRVRFSVAAGQQSPAIILAHEMSHAIRDTFYPPTQSDQLDGQWDLFLTGANKEETRAVNVANRVGDELGEPHRNGYQDGNTPSSPPLSVTYHSLALPAMRASRLPEVTG